MPDVKIPEQVEKKVREAVVLLRKEKDDSLNVFKKLAVAAQVELLDKEVRSLAEARLRGETGVAAKKMSEIARDAGDGDQVKAEWVKVLAEYEDKKKTWAAPAKKSEIEFQRAVDNYAKAMEPLVQALESAKSSNIPRVKAKAKDAQELLVTARDTLKPLSEAAHKAVFDLDDFMMLGEFLKGEGQGPQTLAEVRGFRARFNESIADCRNAQVAIKKQVDDINAVCVSSQKKVEQAIKDMCAAALAWEDTKDIREGTEWVEAIGNGTVSAAQVLAGEPLSAVAVQGLHMLIKGVCTTITVSAAAITAHGLGKKDAMDLAGRLNPDTFIQWKLDLIQIGLEWAAEPLGFIPSVGALVRTAINVATSQITGTLKEAAKKQAAAITASKKQPPDPTPAKFSVEIKEIKDTLWDQFKAAVRGGVEKAPEIKDMIEGVKDPAEAILSAAAVIFGPPLEKVLAKIVPSFDMVSADDVKATLQGARDSVDELAHEKLQISKINLKFAFDEEAAKDKSVTTLRALTKGASCSVMVAKSPQFKTTRGASLLIGSGHNQDDVTFVQSLIKEGSGWEGVMTLVSEGATGELNFVFPDPQAKELVKSYVSHYGSGDNRITRKKLTFG